jgi:hypothetical protein
LGVGEEVEGREDGEGEEGEEEVFGFHEEAPDLSPQPPSL